MKRTATNWFILNLDNRCGSKCILQKWWEQSTGSTIVEFIKQIMTEKNIKNKIKIFHNHFREFNQMIYCAFMLDSFTHNDLDNHNMYARHCSRVTSLK